VIISGATLTGGGERGFNTAPDRKGSRHLKGAAMHDKGRALRCRFVSGASAGFLPVHVIAADVTPGRFGFKTP
jgi:hypothetical protein